ncbi:MAG: YbaK/EbsC family protein [Eubacteriaceae bacterium]|jgi:prolyl-tRNA editing enzyme YbaK/EbsC (Cys-tRNA(Pro) deacylase)
MSNTTQTTDKARAHLSKYGLDERILEFDVSSATVELAAQAAGTSPERIAKSLTFLADGKPIMIVVAGDGRVDNKKFKAQFGTKAKMIPADQVFDLVGYDVGGVCPFDVNEGVPVYLDESLRRFETVYPAAGTSSSAVELSCEELELASGAAGWVDIAKLPQ